MSFDAAIDRRLAIPAGIAGQSKSGMIAVPVADMRPEPQIKSGIDTQLIFGTAVSVFESTKNWAYAQSKTDGYSGYIAASALSMRVTSPTHHVVVPRSFRYREPDMKRPILDVLSLGSQVTIDELTETRGTKYATFADGSAMIAEHLAPVTVFSADPVSIAETLLYTPYLWGGASAFGIDCSGLVQLCFAMCGHMVLRDTDMQVATIGEQISEAELKRGDLIFWQGHVAFYCGDGSIIHASGHTMRVSTEELAAAVARIGYLYGAPTAHIRPLKQSA